MSQENYTAKILGMEDIEVEKIECITLKSKRSPKAMSPCV